MYTTAPMGMVQAVQPPAQQAAALQPQTPAAARFTPVAIIGTLPAATAQPQSKPPTPQPPNLRTAAQIQTASEARTPESYLFDVGLEAPPTPQTPSAATQGRDATQQLLRSRESAVAAQFMMQEQIESADLPDTLDITMMMERAAQRRAAQSEGGAPAPSSSNSNTLARMGQSTILPPTLPSLARPRPIAVAPSDAYIDTSTNVILRRDNQGSVISRGQNAYRQAMQRLGEHTQRVEAIVEHSKEELAAV